MEKFRFCSKCGSKNIKPIYFMEAIDNRFECNSCNSIIFPLEGNEDFRKDFLEELNGKN